MIKEFREFIQRGNVVDLAVAVVIGAAFGKIVTSFVDDILMASSKLSKDTVALRSYTLNSTAAVIAVPPPSVPTEMRFPSSW